MNWRWLSVGMRKVPSVDSCDIVTTFGVIFRLTSAPRSVADVLGGDIIGRRGDARCPLEQVVERGPLIGGQRGEYLVLRAPHTGVRGCKSLLSQRCQLHEVAPPVRAIAATHDQLAIFEIVEQPDNVAGVQTQGLREPMLTLRPVFTKQP